jgi:Bifunctional DNA primase/polymerase, N-terminal
VPPADRLALLERYGRLYGELHLAIAFTAAIEGEDAKRVIAQGWDRTPPLPDPGFGAGLLRTRGERRNPAVVLRPSRLIGIECDTPERLQELMALELPSTVTVQSSAPYKLHFWFRSWDTSMPEFVAFPVRGGSDQGRHRPLPDRPARASPERQRLHLPALAPG